LLRKSGRPTCGKERTHATAPVDGWLAVVVLGASGAAIGSGGVAGRSPGPMRRERSGSAGRDRRQSVHHQPDVDCGAGEWCAHRRGDGGRHELSFRLLLRVPDGERPVDGQRHLVVQSTEIGAAASQAAPFSSVCRVWAPMYRQRTVASLATGPDPTADTVAYRSLLAGWKDYLAHFNDGRPVIFIGHSQGAAMLIRLLASQIDTNAALRSRMVSAIIAGGTWRSPRGGPSGPRSGISPCAPARRRSAV